MFPLSFPLGVLKHHAVEGDTVLDPFVGRGTTLYAGRLVGLPAYGIDSNPVAVAISEAKLANTSPSQVVAAAKRLLAQIKTPSEVPIGDFWRLAFHADVLNALCRLREGLIANCESQTRKALRAIILGALHGPRAKQQPSYFSNQCPRTYAPKPRYAVKFWTENNSIPPLVDCLNIIERRAHRYFGDEQTNGQGLVVAGDSQTINSFKHVNRKVAWIITSPPYYGMRTYLPDQWLRRWFLGGPSKVNYANEGQLSHASEREFSKGLSAVWSNCAKVAASGCRLLIRFGAINDRKIDSLRLLKESLAETSWKIQTWRRAGSAAKGRRQADHFVPAGKAIEEYDVWAKLDVGNLSRKDRTR